MKPRQNNRERLPKSPRRTHYRSNYDATFMPFFVQQTAVPAAGGAREYLKAHFIRTFICRMGMAGFPLVSLRMAGMGNLVNSGGR